MKKFAIGISAAALAFAGTAYAAHYEGRFGPDGDGDGDGVVTRAEFEAHAASMFERMDANSDGKLDQTDRDMRRQDRKTNMFAALDTNNDGSISRDEFMSFKGHGHDMGRGKFGMHDRMGHRHGHRGMMMRMADTNGDGAVSRAEFTAAAAKRFDSIDTNKDGKITSEERQAHHQEMRGKWRERTES